MKKITTLLCLLFLSFNSCENDNSNQAPTIKSKQFTVHINTQYRQAEPIPIGYIEVHDAEGDAVTFQILEQSIENAASVDEHSGALYLNDCCITAGGDIDELIELRVRVSDEQNSTEDFIILDLEED